MHLTSTLDGRSESAGNVPVALFSLDDRRKFLRIYEDYQDTIRHVIERFDLDDHIQLSLRTSTINISEGDEAEVDESSYPFLWRLLGKIQVSVEAPRQVDRRQEKRAYTKSPLDSPPSSLKRNLEIDELDCPTASSTVVHPITPSLDEGKSPTPIPESRGIWGGLTSNVPDPTREEVNDSQEAERRVDDLGERSNSDKLESHQEKHIPLKAAGSFRPIFAELEDTGEGGSNLSPKKFRPADAEPDKEISPPVTIQTEKRLESNMETRPKHPENTPTASQAESEDPRFEIVINGPHEETATFKTRGKHPVRKVLAAACKQFGIKYERARLILLVSIEESGEVYKDEFICPADETMSRCGVDANAKLFVRVEADQDEEYEEE